MWWRPQVELTVEHLPPSAGDLKCEFRKNGVTFSSATAVTGQTVRCDSPGNQSGLDITDDLGVYWEGPQNVCV